jgi:hypothetical protein
MQRRVGGRRSGRRLSSRRYRSSSIEIRLSADSRSLTIVGTSRGLFFAHPLADYHRQSAIGRSRECSALRKIPSTNRLSYHRQLVIGDSRAVEAEHVS